MMNALSLKDAVIVGCSAALVGLIVLLDYITRRHAKERIALDPSHNCTAFKLARNGFYICTECGTPEDQGD